MVYQDASGEFVGSGTDESTQVIRRYIIDANYTALVHLGQWERYRTAPSLRKLLNARRRVRWTSGTNALCGESSPPFDRSIAKVEA